MSYKVDDFVIEEIVSAKFIFKDGTESDVTHWFKEGLDKHDCCITCSRPDGCDAPNDNTGLCYKFQRQ